MTRHRQSRFTRAASVIAICCASLCGGCQEPTDGVADEPLPIESQGTAASVETAGEESAPLPKDIGTRKTGIDWPTFLGPDHNSRSPETGILKPWPDDGPTIVWTRELGVGYAAPVVARGRLFQFSRFGDKARLTAMHSETGEELWRFEYATEYRDMLGYNNGPRCCPVVDGPRVYLYGPEGMLHCVRTEDGKPLWKFDTAKEFGVVQNFFGVGSTPVVENDLLIAQVGGSPPGSPDTYSGRTRPNGTGIVAFDKLTGRVRYKIADELASYASPVPVTIDGRRWCFAFLRGSLVGFDPAIGKIDFQYPWRSKQIESVNASNPVVVGDEVFISETYGPGSSLLKVRSGGYEVVWADDKKRREKAMQTHWNTAVYHKGFLYGSSGRHSSDAELRCIEWATGKVLWSIPKLTRASILLVDGHLVVLSEDGILRLVRATPDKYDLVSEVTLSETVKAVDGVAAATRPLLRSPAWAAPILSHGLLYVRGKDRLVCLELIAAKHMDGPAPAGPKAAQE